MNHFHGRLCACSVDLLPVSETLQTCLTSHGFTGESYTAPRNTFIHLTCFLGFRGEAQLWIGGGGGGVPHFIMQKSKVKVRGSDIHDPLGHGVCVLYPILGVNVRVLLLFCLCVSLICLTHHTHKHSHIQTEKTNSLDFDAQDSTWRINLQSLCKNGKQYHPRNL